MKNKIILFILKAIFWPCFYVYNFFKNLSWFIIGCKFHFTKIAAGTRFILPAFYDSDSPIDYSLHFCFYKWVIILTFPEHE